ncbi:hypothetical protein D083_3407 [Dickeya solani RNS 08.23.3.1.A]|nr:hypothetical protein D083_3407 [Dickeya solani RNS 08.23.3.1.A]
MCVRKRDKQEASTSTSLYSRLSGFGEALLLRKGVQIRHPHY